MVVDGAGGVWVLSAGAASNEADWDLWHVNWRGDRKLYQYPPDSVLAGDGVGGVWVLCETGEPTGSYETDWVLWHVSETEERCLFSYPSDSQLASDGNGGLWILCETECQPIGDKGVTSQVSHSLWHASLAGEQRHCSFPGVASLAGDGRGGVWVLSPSSQGHDASEAEAACADWDLWHVAGQQQRCLFQYPAGACLCGDGHGGVWVFCETTFEDEGDSPPGGTSGENWCLWHAGLDGEERILYKHPKDSVMVGDDAGGLWLLCTSSPNVEGGDGDRCLWHVTENGQSGPFFCSPDSKLACA